MSTVFKNTFAQLFSKVLTSLIGLATRKLLTSYLGPAGFGDYVFLLTYSSIFGSLADWGTITISVREASKHPSSQPQIFGSAIIGRLILSSVACIVAICFSPLIIKNPTSFSLIVLSSVLIIVMALKASFGIVFESLLQMKQWVYVEVTASIFTLMLFFVATLFHLPMLYLFLFLIVATLVACLVGLYLSLKLSKIDFQPNLTLFKNLARESFPMGLALIMFSIYNRVDTVLLGIFRSTSEVGFYGLAYFIYENIVLVAAYILNSVYPLLSKFSSNLAQFRQIYFRYYYSMLILGFFAFFLTNLLSPFFVRLVSSPQFDSAIILLKILSISLFFSFLNHTTGYSLIALGNQKKYSLITLAALALNILLNLYFIPRYGSVAAAWITVTTEGTVQILSLFLINKTLKLMYATK